MVNIWGIEGGRVEEATDDHLERSSYLQWAMAFEETHDRWRRLIVAGTV